LRAEPSKLGADGGAAADQEGVGAGGGGRGVVVRGAVAGGDAGSGVHAGRRGRRRRRRAGCGGAGRGAVGAAVRGDLRGVGGRDAAQHQRQVRRPSHPGAEPARARPRRRLPRPRHPDHAVQAQVDVDRW
jgi:hypothetical protein